MSWKDEFNIMAESMDKREVFLSGLYKQFPNYEDCPDKWKESWMAYKKDRFKNWRYIPAVVKRIKRAAKKKC